MTASALVRHKNEPSAPSAPKPARGSLMCRFARAARRAIMTTFAIAALAYSAYVDANYIGKGAPLTPGEIALVEGIFGDEINASKIRKHFRETSLAYRLAPQNVSGMVLPPLSHIDFYGEKNRVADFSAGSAAQADLFMHEVTHVWQNQNWRWSLHHLHKIRTYDYTLDENSRFDRFALEQKAEIIGHYARIWLHPEGRIQSGRAPREQDILLRNVVEARFPRARETRLALPPPTPRPAAPANGQRSRPTS